MHANLPPTNKLNFQSITISMTTKALFKNWQNTIKSNQITAFDQKYTLEFRIFEICYLNQFPVQSLIYFSFQIFLNVFLAVQTIQIVL